MEDDPQLGESDVHWVVKNVRLIKRSQQTSNSSLYGYVEFQDPKAVPQILDLIHRNQFPPLVSLPIIINTEICIRHPWGHQHQSQSHGHHTAQS